MEQSFRRLLPRRSTSPLASGSNNNIDTGHSVSEAGNAAASSSTTSGRRVSKSVRAACESCRRQKCKCDGKRPSCSHCLRQRTECVYITDSGETRFSALRRKYSSQEEELDVLRKLLEHIRTSAPDEADRLVIHIRSCQDPTEAFNTYFSSRNSQPRTEIETDTDTTPELQIDPRLNAVSPGWPALGVPIHVDAFPWTTVASSDVVCHLISQYFNLERPILLPTVHYQSFTDEMKKGDLSTEVHCSPILVNAICAHQCFLSQRYLQGSIPDQEMGRKFLDECYRILRHKTDRVNSPTAQALALMYQAELAEHMFNVPPDI